MGTRRRYSEEFKREAVSLAKRSTLSRAQVASELGINADTLYNWIRAIRSDRSLPRVYPLRLMCRCLQVSSSGYYAWKTRTLGQRTRENALLLGSTPGQQYESSRKLC